MVNFTIKKEKFLKNSVVIILLILILVVEGCFNFVDFKFNFSKLEQLDFWSNIVTKLFLLILVRTLALLIFQPVFENHNTDLLVEKKRNEQLMQFKDANFSKWIDSVKNTDIKVEAWLKSCNKKLAKLKGSEKDRMLYYSDDENSKSINKYCVKRATLEKFKTQEWIGKNKDNIIVKSVKLNPNVFDLPVGNDSTNAKYKITGNLKTALVGSVIVAGMLMLVTNVIKQALEFKTLETSILSIFIGLILDIILILGQFVGGITDSSKTVENEILVPYVNRNNILIEYMYYNIEDKELVKNTVININKVANDFK